MLAKKRRGFRKIVVDNETCHWRFSGIIEIRPLGKPANRLSVGFGYFDRWLYMNDRENRPPDFEPEVITPAFVRKAIENAVKSGWNTEAERGIFNLRYSGGVFRIENQE